jgi:hypothetical protein
MNETQTPRREVIDNPDGTVTEYLDFEPTEAAMQRLADLLFKEHWGEITVGACIQRIRSFLHALAIVLRRRCARCSTNGDCSTA